MSSVIQEVMSSVIDCISPPPFHSHPVAWGRASDGEFSGVRPLITPSSLHIKGRVLVTAQHPVDALDRFGGGFAAGDGGGGGLWAVPLQLQVLVTHG